MLTFDMEIKMVILELGPAINAREMLEIPWSMNKMKWKWPMYINRYINIGHFHFILFMLHGIPNISLAFIASTNSC